MKSPIFEMVVVVVDSLQILNNYANCYLSFHRDNPSIGNCCPPV